MSPTLARPADPGLLRPVRTDAYPEHTHYEDTGCRFHPACLTCPEVSCLFEVTAAVRRARTDKRPGQARLLKSRGYSPDAAAALLGVRRRQYFRLVQTFYDAS